MYGGPSKKSDFLTATREARESRAHDKMRDSAATKIQSSTRGWITRNNVKRQRRNEFDAQFPPINDNAGAEDKDHKAELDVKPALQRYKKIQYTVCFYGFVFLRYEL